MNSNGAIVQYSDPALDDVKRLANLVRALRDQVFTEGQDFGVIPGTGKANEKPKPSLLLPGMEKLMRALNLRAVYVERHVVRDYDKPLFHYEYECQLVEIDTGRVVSTAVGLATSHESKWRWRDAKRLCPKCGTANINKSKYPPKKNPNAEPGWYCHAKFGGCGAEFSADDPTIITQVTGRMENPDIFDQVNTIAKIAQKRALASAIKGAANVSEFFTVDVDDFEPYDVPPRGDVVDARVTVIEKPAPPVDDSCWPREHIQAWLDKWDAAGLNRPTLKAALGVQYFDDFCDGEDAADAKVTDYCTVHNIPFGWE